MRRAHGRVGNLGLVLVLTAGFGPPGSAQDFRRGDANGDGTFDLSDGSRSLGHLFLGQEAPPCLDAADADDSGEVELTDAVFTFSHLFLGGLAPPSPGPSVCGPDPGRRLSRLRFLSAVRE
jgi:hypothetical protein